MRSWAAILLLVPVLAEAQTAPQDARGAPSLPPIGLPLAPIGLPLPPIGLPQPPGGTPTQSPNIASERRAPGSRSGAPGRRRDAGLAPGAIVVVPPYLWSGTAPIGTPGLSAPTVASAEPAPIAGPRGTVWLEVEPRAVGEVYVDDYLVGTAAELHGVVTMDPGPHRLEVRAPGYEPMRVDIRVEAGGAVTLRRTLSPQVAAPSASAARDAAAARESPPQAIPRKTFYFIPSCYLGDVPPAELRLPAGCEPSKTVVIRPQ